MAENGVVANLTVGSVLALGADPRDPNLSHIHETVHEDDGCTYQYQLVGNRIRKLIVLGEPGNFVSLCPSQGEGQFGGGRSRRIGR